MPHAERAAAGSAGSPRRVVFAPDSFKGSLRAAPAARAMAEGWSRARPLDEVQLLPMADGGEGTLDAFEAAVPGARRMPVRVEGPSGEDVEASWLLLPGDGGRPEAGVVELAATSGIELLPPGDAPRALDASSIGFGQAIASALDKGVGRLVLAVGGSASSDGGSGLLTALGARVLDERGHPVPRGARGLETTTVLDISGMRPPPPGGAVVLTDVESPLLGPRGAAAVFAPQKGASPTEVRRIEEALEVWARLVGADPGQPGSGAAGGAAYALIAWGAVRVPGAEAVADLIGLPDAISGADLVVTGEGSFDAQSAAGKAPSAVLARASGAGIARAIIAGRVEHPPDDCAWVSLTEIAGDAESAMVEPAQWLREAASQLARGDAATHPPEGHQSGSPGRTSPVS